MVGLSELAGTSDVDLLVLDTAGPVVREQAMLYGEALFADDPNLHAQEQIAATMQRLDTDHLRRLQLELLAEGPAWARVTCGPTSSRRVSPGCVSSSTTWSGPER